MMREMFLPSLSGMGAVCFTHPFELTKTRLQLDNELQKRQLRQYHGWLDCIRSNFQKDGIRGLQRGLSMALVRECVFNGMRIGLYTPILSTIASTSASPTGIEKLGAGLICGASAGFFCNPIDILKVRLQSQGGLTGYQHDYMSARQATRQFLKQEGIQGLFRGIVVNTGRGILGPGTQLPAYNRNIVSRNRPEVDHSSK